MRKHKTIFTLGVYLELKKLGFEPVLEKDNINKPGLRCWVYEWTPEFDAALTLAFEQYGSEANGNGR